MSAGKVAGDVADMRATADLLDRGAEELAAIAARTAAGAVDGALLGSIALSPITGASAEKNIVEAAAGPGRIAVKIKALAVLLRAKATLFEAADTKVFKTFTHTLGEYYGGMWEGVKGMGEGVVLLAKLSTTRMLLDPKGWAKDAGGIARGLQYGVTHPVEFGKAIIDWETWKTNPVRAFGRLVPDIVLAAATLGTGAGVTAASRTTKAANVAEDLADAARAADKLKKTPDAPKVDNVTPSKKPTLAESQRYFDDLPRKETPNRTAADAYERRHTGDYNYELSGGGEKVWADGYRVNDAGALEAKHVGDPARSPFVDDSKMPAPLREKILAEQEDEFRRYGEVVRDPSNPVRHVEVITNDPRAVPYFERLLEKYDVPGRVIVRP